MSSYQLFNDEYKALSFGLDHHIPSKTDSNLIYTEFACYYQNIARKIENLSDDQKCQKIFFILFTGKSFEMFPTHNGITLISEYLTQSFPYYLLKSLLKYFLGIMELH